MRLTLHLPVFAAVVAVFSPGAEGQIEQDKTPSTDQRPRTDVLSRARELAVSGHRAEALVQLASALESNPRDGDVRLLYGIVLSWEGRYDDAREHLTQVLDKHPSYADALEALVRVELWSKQYAEAEALARKGLDQWPSNSALLLARAQALDHLGRPREAQLALDKLLAENPDHREARGMRARVADATLELQTSLLHTTEWFSDNRAPWQESSVELQGRTPAGPLIGRFSQAHRSSRTGNQVEVDFYPRLTRRRYLYLNAGHSLDQELYPSYRGGIELYQQLGFRLEGSAGYRRLAFSQRVNVYTASLAKYHGKWLVAVRGYQIPALTGSGRTIQFSGRRFFRASASYVEMRYSTGASPDELRSINDIQVLNADTVSADLRLRLSRRWKAKLETGYSIEDRIDRSGLRRVRLGGGLYFRF